MQQVAPALASPLIDRIVAATQDLARFPRLGRIVPEFALPTLRELIVDDYRVVYDIDRNTVWIATVLHGAMDAGARIRLLRDEP
jgi:plasmid stabilization system protein ParE